MTHPAPTARDENDRIRTGGHFGPDTDTPLMITPGVKALGDDAIARLYIQCMEFDAFDPDESPDHDFGVLDAFGTSVWFKIDRTPDGGRVVTFLLPEEY